MLFRRVARATCYCREPAPIPFMNKFNAPGPSLPPYCLDTARRVHRGSSFFAARTWCLLSALCDKKILMPVDLAVNRAAHAIFFNAGYDASERFTRIEDFELELSAEMADLFEKADVNGAPHFVLQPFFADSTAFHQHLGLTYLSGYCGKSELSGLNVVPLEQVETGPPTGLTQGELEALTNYHRTAALAQVNLLRKCSTALNYIRTGLQNLHGTASGYKDCIKPNGIEELVGQLTLATDLPFKPAAATHFSTDANLKNLLHSLPAGEGLNALMFQR